MKHCEICGREIEAGATCFEIGERETVCIECATKMAVDAQNEKKEIEILEAGKIDEWKLCNWCETLSPVSELREEVNLGWLCGWCIEGIASHGEHLTIRN